MFMRVSPAEAILLEATTIERIHSTRLPASAWSASPGRAGGRTQVACSGVPAAECGGPVAAIDSRGQRAIADDAGR